MATLTASLVEVGLLEREEELAALRGLVAEACDGDGRVVLIDGPPGIGKTELLRACAQEAADAGAEVLEARGSELERDFAFGVARQLFEPAVCALDGTSRADALEGDAALAAPLVGVETIRPVASSRPAELFPFLHGLYWLCSNLSQSRPVLLVIDDAHWADAPSLKFFHYLARRLDELPVMLALAARSTFPEAPVGLIEEIRREPIARTLHPRALSEAGAWDLIAGVFASRPSPEFSSACHESSGGNPFLLTELANSLVADRVQPTASAAKDVREVHTEAISRQVLVRLARLGDGAKAVASAIAIMGPGAEARHFASLAGLGENDGMAILDELVEARVLAPGRPLRFLHPLLGNAVYTDLGSGRRAAEHKRAARLLAEERVHPDRVAAHLLLTEPLGDEWVVSALREAASSAMKRGAPRGAATFLRRALREPPSEPGEVLLELGAAAARSGAHDAPGLLRAALAEATRDESRVRAAVELGMDLANAGRLEEAATMVRQVLNGIDPERKELVRPLEMVNLVLTECSVFGRREGAALIARAERAVARRGDGAPKGLLAIIAFERALVSATADEVAALAASALAGGHLLAEQPVDSAHVHFACAALAMSGRIYAADRHLGDAIAASRARGSLRGAAFATAMRAPIRHQRGDLAGAEQDAETFFDLEAGADWNVYRLAAASALADINIDHGNLDAADEVLAGIDRKVDHLLFLPLRMSRVRLALSRRDHRLAGDELEKCAEWELNWGVRIPVWCEWRSLAALTHAAAGDSDEAQRLAAEQVDLVRPFGSSHALGNALHAAGLVAEGADAIELLLSAASQLQQSEATLDHAQALADLGAAMRRANRRVESREPLRQAIDLARRCGALPLAERAHDELRATGAKPRRLILTGVESLTARELQVARIASTGLTNREIAQDLFVSKKTVETHLGHIYSKLAVSSREEVAEALAGAEMDTPPKGSGGPPDAISALAAEDRVDHEMTERRERRR